MFVMLFKVLMKLLKKREKNEFFNKRRIINRQNYNRYFSILPVLCFFLIQIF